jgi:hypothetical protein
MFWGILHLKSEAAMSPNMKDYGKFALLEHYSAVR